MEMTKEKWMNQELIERNQMIESQLSSRDQKRFFYTTETNGSIFNTDLGKYDTEAEPMDYNRPPGDQQPYYRQQVVAGQPVYQYGPPPPPVHGGRMEAYRSGRETAIAREERGERRQGGFSSFFGSGGNEQDDESVERLFLFNTVQIRNRFIRKVYTLLTIQLLITFGFIMLAIHVDAIRIFMLRNFVVLIVVMCLTLVFVIAIVCCEGLRKIFPYNLIALCILTLLYAYMLAAVSCIYDTVAVYMATGTTAIVCFSVSILACQMKWDITKCGCMLYILLIGLMIYGIVCSILIFFVNPETFRVMHLVYGGIGLAIFILYLMFDTQMIMGGRYIELSPEEYVLGALKLYIDIIMIFQFLMMLFRR